MTDQTSPIHERVKLRVIELLESGASISEASKYVAREVRVHSASWLQILNAACEVNPDIAHRAMRAHSAPRPRHDLQMRRRKARQVAQERFGRSANDEDVTKAKDRSYLQALFDAKKVIQAGGGVSGIDALIAKLA